MAFLLAILIFAPRALPVDFANIREMLYINPITCTIKVKNIYIKDDYIPV